MDVDVRKYFDTVNHELLLDAVNEEVSDGSVLRLLRMFLESGVMEDGVWRATEEGTPQGGVISPLLANIYLNRFDWKMAKRAMTWFAMPMILWCCAGARKKRKEPTSTSGISLKMNYTYSFIRTRHAYCTTRKERLTS